MTLDQLLDVADYLANILRVHRDALDHLTSNADAISAQANAIRDQLAELAKTDPPKQD